jgi:hypothetical protein
MHELQSDSDGGRPLKAETGVFLFLFLLLVLQRPESES